MQCPVCKDTQLVMSERAGVEIDYCPQCRGIWLDRGELDKILERGRQDAAPAPQAAASAPAYRQDDRRHEHSHTHSHDKHYGQKPYRKKSFLEELFD
ncbi:zf-TFIIB domain-containing protein [Chitinimonas sp. BJYL2]|uniref:TFIIB-type zinc ribbon-containing protein n=1 Tax=Chitinimonas sp. BJYL2 TaxID=2976696 RepID=UPI0022B59FA1|nr:zf-TFIIB domain-containing protein [Chitinimonas sp. BJYL2]